MLSRNSGDLRLYVGLPAAVVTHSASGLLKCNGQVQRRQEDQVSLMVAWDAKDQRSHGTIRRRI